MRGYTQKVLNEIDGPLKKKHLKNTALFSIVSYESFVTVKVVQYSLSNLIFITALYSDLVSDGQ